MPARNTSSKRRRFGLFLGELRDSCDETQEEFSKRLHCSLSTIKNIDTGGPPSAAFVASLIREFPTYQETIEREVARWTDHRARSTRRRRTSRLLLDTLLTENRLNEAREHLVREIDNYHDMELHIWAREQLSIVERMRGNNQTASCELLIAISQAEQELDDKSKLRSLLERLANVSCEDGHRQAAHDAIERALASSPTTGSLWYRKGLLYWSEGDLTNAFTALTTALGCRGPRVDILCIRAQIFIAWEQPGEALADIIKVLEDGSLSQSRAVCMRCARVYVEYVKACSHIASKLIPPDETKETVRAFSALSNEIAESPDDPWPYYFRARCLQIGYELHPGQAHIMRLHNEAVPDDYLVAVAGMRQKIHTDLMQAMRCDTHYRSLSQYVVGEIISYLRELADPASLHNL
jgi:tetratricopeptide (TPR) repeat protein